MSKLDGGMSLFDTLEKVGFSNVRIEDALLRASGAGICLQERIDQCSGKKTMRSRRYRMSASKRLVPFAHVTKQI